MRARLWMVVLPFALQACTSERALRAACEAGEAGACDVLSARYAYGDGVRKDPNLAAEFGARASELCARPDAGATPSCDRFPRVKAVPLDLPAPPPATGVQTVFSVSLAADGTTDIDGKRVPNDDAVLAVAQVAHDKNPELRAVIKADASVSHGRVIHVLDQLKQAQISKIAFGVSPVSPKPAPSDHP